MLYPTELPGQVLIYFIVLAFLNVMLLFISPNLNIALQSIAEIKILQNLPAIDTYFKMKNISVSCYSLFFPQTNRTVTRCVLNDHHDLPSFSLSHFP